MFQHPQASERASKMNFLRLGNSSTLDGSCYKGVSRKGLWLELNLEDLQDLIMPSLLPPGLAVLQRCLTEHFPAYEGRVLGVLVLKFARVKECRRLGAEPRGPDIGRGGARACRHEAWLN